MCCGLKEPRVVAQRSFSPRTKSGLPELREGEKLMIHFQLLALKCRNSWAVSGLGPPASGRGGWRKRRPPQRGLEPSIPAVKAAGLPLLPPSPAH